MSRLLSPGLALALAWSPSVAAASLAADEEILVIDRAYGSLTAPSVEEARRLIQRTPGGVDLVASERFQSRYALNMQDMLAHVPGVYARQRFAEEVRLSIRGSGLSRSFHMRGVKLLQDGMPLTAADNASDFQEVDPLSLRYIAVHKGGNALRYGAANLGGAVNFVTPTGHTAPARAMFSLEGGSFDTLRVHGALAGVAEDHDFHLSATGITSDGYRPQSEQRSARFNGNLGLKLTERAETRFYLTYNHIDQEMPGTISLRDALNAPKTVPAVNLLNDYARDIRALRVANRTSIDLGNTRLEAGLYGLHKDLYHPIFQVMDQTIVEYGVFGRAEMALGRASLTLGINAGGGETDAKRYVNVGGQRGVMTADADQKARNLEIYGEGRVTLVEGFELIAGGQFIHTRRRYEDQMTPSLSARRTYESFSPKFGVLWEPAEAIQAFANLSRSYEPPTFSELVQSPVPGFVPLDAQRAWTAEIGTRGSHGPVSWDLALYRAHVKGELLQFNVGPDIPAPTFNADRTLHQGVELGVAVRVLDHLALRHSYMLNDFRFRDDAIYGGNRLAGLPKHLYRGELEFRKDGLYLTAGVDWAISRAHVDFANTLQVPRHAVVALNGGYRLENGLSFYGEARNLFDKRYIANFGTLTDARLGGNQDVFYPGDGRAFFLGVKWEFGA